MAGGIDNLTPVRSVGEAREKGKKGGIASGKARRKKRDFRQLMRLLLDMPADELEKADNREAICAAMIQKALAGDRGAAEFCRDTAGEGPKQQIDHTSSDGSMAGAIDVRVNFVNVQQAEDAE